MQITIHNYESYFIDYLDGNLSSGLMDELLLFLQQHPDLKEELEDLGDIALIPDTTAVFDGKDALKHNLIVATKNIHENNYENLLIARLEGELNTQQSQELDDFLECNPQLKNEAALYTRLRLEADPNLVFPNKASLKKRILLPLNRRMLYWSFSAAASIIILLSLVLQFNLKPNFQSGMALNDTLETPIDKQLPAYAMDPQQTIPSFQEKTAPVSNTSKLNTQPVLTAQKTPKHPNKIVVNPQQTVNAQRPTTTPLLRMPSTPPPVQLAHQTITAPQIEDTRFLNSLLFDDLMLSEYLRPNKKPTQKKPLLARLIQGVISGKKQSKRNPDKVNLWQLAALGVDGFNYITRSEVKLETEKNEDGKVIAYALSKPEGTIVSHRKNNKQKAN